MITLIWLAGLCNKLSIIALIGIFSCLAIIVGTLLYDFDLYINNASILVKTIIRRTLIVLTIFVTIFVFTPSQKSAYLMLSIYVGQEITKESNTQNLLDKAYKILNHKLDEVFNEEGMCKK